MNLKLMKLSSFSFLSLFSQHLTTTTKQQDKKNKPKYKKTNGPPNQEMTRLGLVVSVTFSNRTRRFFLQREREGEPREHDCRRFGLSLRLLSHLVFIIYTVVLFNFKKPNTQKKNKKKTIENSNKSQVSGIVLFIYLFVCFICSFSFLYLFFPGFFSLFMFCFFFFREHQPVNLHAFLQLSDRVHSRPEKEHTEKYCN